MYSKNKILTFITVIFMIILVFSSCKVTEKTSKDSNKGIVEYTDSLSSSLPVKIIIDVIKGKEFNHPSFVIWEEDVNGNYIRTIFITRSYASGIFAHQMIGDTLWLKTRGSSYQPAALPYWNYKKGKIDDKFLIPTSENPYIDAYTGETPLSNFKIESGIESKAMQTRILLEVNQPWDWNSYWSNNKYPNNPAYKHSAQPSIVYAATINKNDYVLYLNPIGHGDPKGESNKLYTDLSTLTTAKEILGSVRVRIKQK